MDATLMCQEIADRDSSAGSTAILACISILHRFEPVSKAVSDESKSLLNVNIVHRSETVRIGRHGKEQCGAEQVRNLQANLILAMSVHRHFEEVGVTISSAAELPGENRVRNPGVLMFVPVVRDNQPALVRAMKEVLEGVANRLHRKSVEVRGVD